MDSLLEEVYLLVKDGQTRAALCALYDLLDDALTGGDYARCDRSLAILDAARLNSACWVGILGITRTAKMHLPSWAKFYREVMTLTEARYTTPQVLCALRGME